MKFVRKPEIVEAEQWVGQPHQFVKMLPGEVKIGWLTTPTGGCAVTKGDWILKDATGQYSVVKPHVFNALYERTQ